MILKILKISIDEQRDDEGERYGNGMSLTWISYFCHAFDVHSSPSPATRSGALMKSKDWF